MTKLQDNLICENFKPEELTFASCSAAEYAVDMTDCKEEVQLILDAADASSAVTLVMKPGDYPMKSKERSYEIPAGSCKLLSISGGETMQSDGMAHFTLNGNLRVAVLKRRFVTNH